MFIGSPCNERQLDDFNTLACVRTAQTLLLLHRLQNAEKVSENFEKFLFYVDSRERIHTTSSDNGNIARAAPYLELVSVASGRSGRSLGAGASAALEALLSVLVVHLLLLRVGQHIVRLGDLLRISSFSFNNSILIYHYNIRP